MGALGALSALGINTGNLLISTICLMIAYIIIARFIIAPIRTRAKERQDEIEAGLDNAEKAKTMIAEAEGNVAEIQKKAEAEAAEIITTANQQATKLREDYRAQVDAENMKQLRSTKAYLDQERELMLSRLRDQIIELSIEGAKKLIGEELSIRPEKQRQLLISLFTGIRDGRFPSITDDFPKDLSKIEITTAIALTDEEKSLITEEFKPRLQENGVIDFQIDPKILGGVVVHSGNILIDHSISGRARELKEALHQ